MAERSVPANPENIAKAINLIDHQKGGGGTELLPALQRALALPRPERAARTVIIATDGYVTVETQAFDLIRQHLGDANFFSFGIGSSVNRFLIEGMARAGAGESFVLANPNEAPARAEKFRQYVQSPLLTQIKLDFGGFDTYDVEPASVPDVFAERPVIVFGKWRGQPKGKISLRGLSGERNYEHTIDVASVQPQASNSALRSLWARSAITRLSDYNVLQQSDQRIAEVTDLGLKYNLLTAYTSFVAIDSEVRRKEGDLTTVNQPLPLPEGVSDYAVGSGVPMASLPTQGMPKMAARESRGGGGFLSYGRPAAPSLDSAEHSVSSTRLSESKPTGTVAGKTQPTGKDVLAGAEEEKSDDGKGKHKSDWRVKIDSLSVAGGLSETAVRRAIEEKTKEILDCLPTGFKAGAREKVTVRWTVDGEGKVVDVKIISARPRLSAIEKCLTDRIRGWRFAAPTQPDATVTATFLFEFSRK